MTSLSLSLSLSHSLSLKVSNLCLIVLCSAWLHRFATGKGDNTAQQPERYRVLERTYLAVAYPISRMCNFDTAVLALQRHPINSVSPSPSLSPSLSLCQIMAEQHTESLTREPDGEVKVSNLCRSVCALL